MDGSLYAGERSRLGINENVHTVERWAAAFAKAGLSLQAYSLSDSFNAIYRKASDAPTQTDVRSDYYAAVVSVTPAAVDMQRGVAREFAVTVESRGRAAWASRGPTPVRLSYHVSRVDGAGMEVLAFDNERTLLPSFICPGAPETFTVAVTLGEVGTYALEFDLVHEARCWFKERGAQTAVARVVVGD